MSARFRIEPSPGDPGALRLTVACPHGFAQQRATERLFLDAKVDIVQFATDVLEDRLHHLTGCDCRVRREGEMASR
jgi:hypothetical protein